MMVEALHRVFRALPKNTRRIRLFYDTNWDDARSNVKREDIALAPCKVGKVWDVREVDSYWERKLRLLF
ncbi:hypothetical protein Tco_0853620 [Tanacetum coccineum]